MSAGAGYTIIVYNYYIDLHFIAVIEKSGGSGLEEKWANVFLKSFMPVLCTICEI